MSLSFGTHCIHQLDSCPAYRQINEPRHEISNDQQSKKEGKDQELIQSGTTRDPGYQWESDFTIRHHKREPRGQPFPSR